jgi:hypothetical protein
VNRQYRHLSSFLRAGLLAAVVGGCGAGDRDAASLRRNIDVGSGASNLFIRPGQGFDKASEQFFPQCVRSSPEIHGPPGAVEISMDHSVNSEKIYNDMGFNVGARAKFKLGVVTTDVDFKTDLARTTSQDSYSEAFVFRAAYDLGNIGLDDNSFSNTQIGDGAEKTMTWTENCGDEFVYQVKTGARFYVIYRIDFASKAAKDWFHLHAHLDANGQITQVNLDTDLHTNSYHLRKQAKVHVEAYQFGGDPTQLTAVLTGTGGSIEKQDQASRALLDCSIDNLEACKLLLSNATSYLRTDAPNGLPQQLQKTANAAPLTYITMPWTRLQKNTIPKILTKEITDARTRLESKFDKILQADVRVDRLLNQGLPLPQQQLADLGSWHDKLKAQLVAVNAAVKACYDDLTYDPKAGGTPLPDRVSACGSAVDSITFEAPPASVLDGAGQYLIDEVATANGLSSTNPYVTTPDGQAVYKDFPNARIYWSSDSDTHVVWGAILGRFQALNAHDGVLGFPASDEVAAGSDGKGRVSFFQGGAIYYSASTGAHAVFGPAMQKYWEQGQAGGALGYPLIDTTPVGNSVNGGLYVDFERGSIYSSNSTGAHVVIGAIRGRWLQEGGAQGAGYGFPVSDEMAGNGANRVSRFEHGAIFYVVGRGTFGVNGGIFPRYWNEQWNPGTDENSIPIPAVSFRAAAGDPMGDPYYDQEMTCLTQDFQNGSMVLNRADGWARFIVSGSRDKWSEMRSKYHGTALYPGSTAGDTYIYLGRNYITPLQNGWISTLSNGQAHYMAQKMLDWRNDHGSCGLPTEDSWFTITNNNRIFMGNLTEHGHISLSCTLDLSSCVPMSGTCK